MVCTLVIMAYFLSSTRRELDGDSCPVFIGRDEVILREFELMVGSGPVILVPNYIIVSLFLIIFNLCRCLSWMERSQVGDFVLLHFVY
jgi:hypothetical protein